MSERVTCTVTAGVADVRMNRPEKRNALDLPLFEGLIATGLELGARKDVRAVVLSGNGLAFSAGLDFASFLSLGAEGSTRMLSRGADSPANVAQRAAWIWSEVPVPVIAAVHGAAFGGGLQIALACDLRYAAPDAQLSVMEIKWGLIPDMSGARTLLDLLPLDVAKELTFTGRVVSGPEARELGLVTRVVADPLAAALETAQTIAGKSPHAIRAGKRLLSGAARMETRALFELETELQVALLGSPNQMEAVGANLGKRPPEFKDPE